MSDVYVALHVSTTADENGVYVARDSSEILELAWSLVNASTLQEIHKDSVLVKPINTPITPLCTNLTTLTWEHVRNAGTLKDAIRSLDYFLQEYVIKNNLEFSFVTMNSWDLRMKLPKESRERSIMLPPYLELSRYFDLKKEFLKWQEQVHPDYAQSSNVSLSQMLLQLDVDLSTLQPSTPALQTPFQINSPKRAIDEVNIMVSVLRALLKKASHNTVLRQPHDSHLDLKQFFQEKSKILYMSNLPIDTTQSELESWFTQFGGRPIAFWTLKSGIDSNQNNNNHQNNFNHNNINAAQSKPTANGFAIFATHDEAVDSLSMNGRLLNDRVIEVQPSSVRVLDRSQEILTPFPSSKNRPRPGDWTCPSCGFSNFQRRTACFRCSFPAASAAAIQESMYPGKTNGAPQNNFNQAPQQGHHHQQQHHNNNNNSTNNNNNHHGPNHLHSNHHDYNQFNGPHHHNNNSTHNHGNLNHPAAASNRNTSSVPFRAGDWKCDLCLYHNFAKNISCLKCGSPRSNSTNANGNRQTGLPSHAQVAHIQSNSSQNSLIQQVPQPQYPQQQPVGSHQQQHQQAQQPNTFQNNYYSASNAPTPLQQQHFSQLPTPTSSTTNSTTALTPQFMQQAQQPDLMINQINSLNLNNNLYRTNTGSTNTNNSNVNLTAQPFISGNNDLGKRNDESQ